MIVVDTGPLVAAALDGDTNHMRCVELFTALHLDGEPLMVPSLVVTEVCYLLSREAGPRIETDFVRSLAAGDLSRRSTVVTSRSCVPATSRLLRCYPSELRYPCD